MSSPASPSSPSSPLGPDAQASGPHAQPSGSASKTGLIANRKMLTSHLTFHGHSLDVISSWLQKAVRRNLASDASYCLKEWLLFGLPEVESQLRKAVLSNLRNRMVIYVVEDHLAFCEPGIVMAVQYWMEKWETAYRTMSAGAYLDAALTLIQELPRGRLASDVKAQFQRQHVDDYEPKPASINLKQQEFRRHLNLGVKHVPASGGDSSGVTSSPLADNFVEMVECGSGDDPRAIEAAGAFWYYLYNKDSRCFHFMFKVLHMSFEGKSARYLGHQTIDFLLWVMVLHYARGRWSSFVAQLLEWYKDMRNKGESYMFLVQAVLLVLHQDKITQEALNRDDVLASVASIHGESIPEDALKKMEQEWEINIQHFAQHAVKQQPPDWAVDKHTREGKAAGKGYMHFALEGSYVAPSDAKYDVFMEPGWRLRYMEIKQIQAQGEAKPPPKVKALPKKRKGGEEEEANEFASKKARIVPSLPNTFGTDFDVVPGTVQLAQWPAGGKPFTYLARIQPRPRDGQQFNQVGRFIRPKPAVSKTVLDSVAVDAIKVQLGLVSAESTIWVGAEDGSQWLVGRDLGLGGPYPTTIQCGQVVVDKSQTGCIPIKAVPLGTATPLFWQQVWQVLLWRKVLDCSDTNTSNILWRPQQGDCVSVDEMGSQPCKGQEECTDSHRTWFAQLPNKEFMAALAKHYQPLALYNTLQGWSNNLLLLHTTPLARKLLARIPIVTALLSSVA
jgi:hypothetical protein